MKVTKYAFGNVESIFDTDTDQEDVEQMIADLKDRNNDIIEYAVTSTDQPILTWPMDDQYEDEYGEDDWHPYSPSCPWLAPGMSVSDFIR